MEQPKTEQDLWEPVPGQETLPLDDERPEQRQDLDTDPKPIPAVTRRNLP